MEKKAGTNDWVTAQATATGFRLSLCTRGLVYDDHAGYRTRYVAVVLSNEYEQVPIGDSWPNVDAYGVLTSGQGLG